MRFLIGGTQIGRIFILAGVSDIETPLHCTHTPNSPPCQAKITLPNATRDLGPALYPPQGPLVSFMQLLQWHVHVGKAEYDSAEDESQETRIASSNRLRSCCNSFNTPARFAIVPPHRYWMTTPSIVHGVARDELAESIFPCSYPCR